jgi:hypothetical protein
MVLDDGKLINVKVSRKGKLQMTGCKSIKHAIDFIKYLYSTMIEAEEWTGETMFSYKTKEDEEDNDEVLEDPNGEDDVSENNPQDMFESDPDLDREKTDGLTVVFKTAMMNLDFDIGYRIRRDLLNIYINRYTEFRSIFESSIKTSVNVKLGAHNKYDRNLPRLRITAQGQCIEDSIPCEEFLSSLSKKELKTENKKEPYHTFLVFASGSIIMSSTGLEMPDIFNRFVKILVDHRKQIEEINDQNVSIDTSWLDKGSSALPPADPLVEII